MWHGLADRAGPRPEGDTMTSRLALVTGASRGLGRAWAAVLLAAGWTVIGDGRDPDALADAAAALGDGFVPVVGDVTDAAHRRALAVEVAARGGGLDALVHNAGGLGPTPLPDLLDVGHADLGALFDVNVVAPLALTAELRGPLEAAAGAVVVVTSDVTRAAYRGWGAYGLTKAALEHAVGTLATEHPRLRVHALDPGDVRTDMHQAAFPGEDISDRADPADVAPALVALLDADLPSGARVAATELLAPTAGRP